MAGGLIAAALLPPRHGRPVMAVMGRRGRRCLMIQSTPSAATALPGAEWRKSVGSRQWEIAGLKGGAVWVIKTTLMDSVLISLAAVVSIDPGIASLIG